MKINHNAKQQARFSFFLLSFWWNIVIWKWCSRLLVCLVIICVVSSDGVWREGAAQGDQLRHQEHPRHQARLSFSVMWYTSHIWSQMPLSLWSSHLITNASEAAFTLAEKIRSFAHIWHRSESDARKPARDPIFPYPIWAVSKCGFKSDTYPISGHPTYV